MFSKLVKKFFGGSAIDARALEYAALLRPMLGKTWILDADRPVPTTLAQLKDMLQILEAAKGHLQHGMAVEFDKDRYVCYAITSACRERGGKNLLVREVTYVLYESLSHWINYQLDGKAVLEKAVNVLRPEDWWVGLRQYWLSQMIDELKDKIKEMQ